jgi:hypothetical protein
MEPPVAAVRLFSLGSVWWNTPIPPNPAVDPHSDAIVAQLARDGTGCLSYAESNPVFYATPATPRYTVRVTNDPAWGHSTLTGVLVPTPPGMAAGNTYDGPIIIIDPVGRRVYELWQATKRRGIWSCTWGAVCSLDGDGTPGTRAAGLSILAGMILESEVRAGRIDHALVFITRYTRGGCCRAPATNTDGGQGRYPDTIPEGARIQLDPATDLARIPGIRPIELMVGRALQTYGAICGDTGDTCLTFSMENTLAEGGTDTVYRDAGVEWDYYGCPHIPWAALRVLAGVDIPIRH